MDVEVAIKTDGKEGKHRVGVLEVGKRSFGDMGKNESRLLSSLWLVSFHNLSEERWVEWLKLLPRGRQQDNSSKTASLS